MKNISFIIPIHPKHYHYIYDLIDIFCINNIIIDIHLVFSNECDYNNFEKKDKIKKIIIPYTTRDSIVIYKKFFALEQLKNNIQYDYFIVCDAEITIIPENFTEKNILNKINNIYTNKLIYGGMSNDIEKNKITEQSAIIFDVNNKLKNMTNNYILYYWWSDLPIYKREHLIDFFSKFNYNLVII